MLRTVQILILVFVISSFNSGAFTTNTTFDPTGTYRPDSKPKKKNGEIYGYFGEIRIKMIDDSTMAVSFYVCKGAPSYNSGSFVDTIHYYNKHATYLSGDDSTCRIEFFFTAKGLIINQYQNDLNFGCGFGHGVFADGYYRRASKKIPIITDLMDEDIF